LTGQLKDLVSVKGAHLLNDDWMSVLVDAVEAKWVVFFDRVQLRKLECE